MQTRTTKTVITQPRTHKGQDLSTVTLIGAQDWLVDWLDQRGFSFVHHGRNVVVTAGPALSGAPSWIATVEWVARKNGFSIRDLIETNHAKRMFSRD